jgi:hypothetical protein
MPRAMRVDRLLGEHGMGQDSAARRQEFERQMERRRLEALDEKGHSPAQRPRHAWPLLPGGGAKRPCRSSGLRARESCFRTLLVGCSPYDSHSRC